MAALAAAVVVGGCVDPGEPTPSPARVAWIAHPETVRTGETFSFEMAGPTSTSGCGRLDTAVVTLTGSTVELEARRSVFLEAMCSDERGSWYRVRPLRIDRPGRYRIVDGDGRRLGTLVAAESARFSAMSARGLGTLGVGGGCVFLGPGWTDGQRPFALRGLPPELERLAGTDTLVHVVGRLVGHSLCGGYGSRPAIRVDSARATDRTGASWYPEPPAPGGTEATGAEEEPQRGEEP